VVGFLGFCGADCGGFTLKLAQTEKLVGEKQGKNKEIGKERVGTEKSLGKIGSKTYTQPELIVIREDHKLA